MDTMNRKNWIQKRKQIPNKQERNFRIACGLLPFFKRYPSIGIYLPILEEVDVLDHCGFQLYDQPNDQHYVYRDSKLLSKSEFEAIQWSAPKVESESVMRFYPLDQLERGAFGILEPKGEKSGQQEVIPSMIIVPLVAFCDGYRKGYGKGYYQLERGAFGILEPKGEKSGQQEVIPSMIIVPLVAFCDGYRKGYGKGYYDRYLQNHPQSLRVGIAFDQQEASFIHEQWDQRLDVIITETRVLIYPRCSEE